MRDIVTGAVSDHPPEQRRLAPTDRSSETLVLMDGRAEMRDEPCPEASS